MVDIPTTYDYKTIGRFPPRVHLSPPVERWDGGADTNPLLWWFDGKSLSPLNRKRVLDAFTGFGVASLDRKSKLRHNDYDYAQAFLASEFAFRCVQIIASDIDGIRHGVRDKTTKQPSDAHPLAQAIVYARRMYQQNLISLWQKSLGVWGEAYIQPEKNVFGLAHGLRWLNPIAVTPRIEYGAIAGFDYTAGGAYFFKPHELIFDKVDSLLDDLRGQSKIAVALDAINVDREIKRYTLDTLIKDMRMAGILTGRQGSGLSQADLDDAVAKIKEQKDARLIAIAPQLEYQRVQQEIDGSQLQLSEDARRRIAAAIGVPMSIAGAWDSATYQSAPEQKRFYYESVIFRECERHARVMNEVVMPFFDLSGQYEFYYDTDSVASLLEDKTAKSMMVNSRLQAGNLTINQAREALGDKPLPGGDVLLIPSGYTLVPVAQLPALAQQPAALPPGDTPALPMAVDAVAVPETQSQPGLKSACLVLKLGAQPDLLALQNRVKQLLADDDVTWNEPDDFHITLAYAPAVTEAQMAALTTALADVELPELTLRVGSLRTFDNLGEYAVHFQIRRNTDLLDFQEEVYNLFEQVGILTSAFSRPEAYKPHITVGYCKVKPRAVVFEGKLTVTPVALELSEDDEVVWQQSVGETTAIETDGIQAAALDELDAWQKKTRNKSATAPFKNYLIRDAMADAIRLGLEQAAGDKEAVKAVFARARDVVRVKAVQATRVNFEDAFEAVLKEALAGNLTRRRWSTITRSLISQYCNKAYRDGLVDGGVDDEPDEAEQDAIAAHIRAQSEYVTNLGATLYHDENTVSKAMADQKPQMWWNKSIEPMYTAGLVSAAGNALHEWVVGDTEHCSDCKRLDGQRHRLKDFYRRNLIPKSDLLECGGFNCACSLVKVAGKARGNF